MSVEYRHDRGCLERKVRGGPFVGAGAEDHYPPDLRAEPVHMALSLLVDIPGATLVGTNRLTVVGHGAGTDTLTLDAVDFLDVAVTDARGKALAFDYDGSKLVIHWDKPLGGGSRRQVEVAWRVQKPASGLYFSSPTGAYPNAATYAATDNETERARHWMPCIDLPSVRPTLEIALRAPDGLTMLANGAHVGDEVHDDGTRTVRWKLDQPCPSYLTCVVVGDLLTVDDGAFGDVPVAYFASHEFDEDDVRRAFGKTRAMLAWMAEKLGHPFPYPKYYQFALPGFGGAMENISLVSWDDRFLLDESLAREWTRLVDQINVHEMAHSYFGDLIVCRDFAHAWLKESWATYIEQCWFEDVLGAEEGNYEFFLNAQAYFSEADEHYQRPIVTRRFESSWQLYDRHLYPGGACRLHTLRKLLGDDVFWEGVRLYVKRYAGRTVETDHFRHTLEEVSGRSLGAFFDQWFHRKGYPRLAAKFRWDKKAKLGFFEIEQEQIDAEQGVEAFDFDVEVGWTDEAGASHVRSVRLHLAKQSVAVPMEAEPVRVRIDPGSKVLCKLDFNPGDDKLRAQIAAADDVVGRILAGRELVKTGKRRNVEVVRDATMKERFWGVRAEHAKTLGRASNEAALDALVELVGWERDPMVLEHLYAAIGRYRDPRIVEVLKRRLETGVPHRATAAAYVALGAQRDQAPLGLLVEAAEREGFGGWEQSGALKGLAATRRKKAIRAVSRATVYGQTPNRSARPAAVAALGELAATVDGRKRRAEVVERLTDLLRDPVDRVRLSAARALSTAGAHEAIPALQAFANTVSHQEAVMVRTWVARLRKKRGAEPSAKDEVLDELREKVRKLEEAVDKLEARVTPAEEER